MKFLFNLGLCSIFLYLILDVVLAAEEGGVRPIVQAVAGVSVLLLLAYNISSGLTSRSIRNYWTYPKYWLYFIGLLGLYSLLALVEVPSDAAIFGLRHLVVAVYGLAVMFFIYYGTVSGHLKEIKVDVVILFLCINGLYEIYNAIQSARSIGGVEVVNTSAGYVFLMISPLLMYRFRENNIWFLVATLLFTLMTGKRGALLIYGVVFLYMFFNYKIAFKYLKVNIRMFLVFSVIICAGLIFLDGRLEGLLYRLMNIVDERTGNFGSGRDVIWSTLLAHWADGGFFRIFFGSGFFSTLAIEGHVAHNDFIEFLVDFGVVGLTFYLFVLYKFYVEIRLVKRYDHYLYLLMMVCFLILVGRGFIAGTIRPDNINLSISIGYLLAMSTLRRVCYARKN